MKHSYPVSLVLNTLPRRVSSNASATNAICVTTARRNREDMTISIKSLNPAGHAADNRNSALRGHHCRYYDRYASVTYDLAFVPPFVSVSESVRQPLQLSASPLGRRGISSSLTQQARIARGNHSRAHVPTRLLARTTPTRVSLFLTSRR